MPRRICQPLRPESSRILLRRQKNEDLKMEDGRYVKLWNWYIIIFELWIFSSIRNVLDRQPFNYCYILSRNCCTFRFLNRFIELFIVFAFIYGNWFTLWDYWVLCSNFDPPGAIMSSVSLQTFAELYLVESSVMSSIRTQVHVTIYWYKFLQFLLIARVISLNLQNWQF